MRVAICDDTPIDREIMMDLLHDYAIQKGIPIEIVEYERGMDLLYDMEDGSWFDLIMLDIYLGDTLGIHVAHRLREMQYNRSIVFLTASPEFAIDSYDVHADGYILKPHGYTKLSKVMDYITRNMDISVYQIRQRSTIIHIPLHEILYIESNNSKCILHRSTGKDYVIYKTLNQIEQELNDKRFLRSHQSYLVNMDYIQQVDKQFHLTTGDTVGIRQRTLKAVRQAYLDYVASKSKADATRNRLL